MYMKYIVALFIIGSFCFSQVSIDSIPKSFNLEQDVEISIEELPAFDIESFLEEDEGEMRSSIIKPYRFANSIPVHFNMNNSGNWITLEDGSLIWRLEIQSIGAYSLNVIYDIFDIPEGAEFFVYSDDREMVLGAFTNFNHKPHGGFSTAPVIGDKIILEYNEPINALFHGNISINTVAHDYRNIFFNENRDYGSSGSCNNNTMCGVGDEWRDEIRSVAMILTAGGSRLCTGSLVNNGAQDLVPYFLTANHCLGGNDSWIFMFNYESPTCSNQNGPTNMTISGSSLLVDDSTSDVALLLLNEIPPENYNIHYAGWDVSGNIPTTPVGIHHPSGDIKKISFDYDNASNSGNFWDVNNWDDGTTEPGSSGSPLFDGLNKRIIGQLYGGTASCTSITYDTYGKTSVSWNLGLNNYLDPNNTGLTYIDGIDSIDLPDPALSYSDFDLIFELDDGDSDFSSFEISNTGEPESMLLYSVKISGFENPLGGPDIAENYWTDSDNEIELSHDWIDISNVGTQYNFENNDESGSSINIGFDFPFYGQIYNQCIINPNGWIGFGSDSDEWNNTSIPSSSAPLSAIFGFWDDLNPINDNCDSCSGEVYYHADESRMVVWFDDVAHWANYFDNSVYNFQIVIYSTGEIRFNYNSMSGDLTSATIGMQNTIGNSGLQMSFNSNYAHDSLTTYISKAPSWVGINEIGDFELIGEITSGFSQFIDIIVENDQLSEGLYNAYLNISSNASQSSSFPIELLSLNATLLGDVNGDSSINIQDIIIMVNTILTNQDSDNADINGDGNIDVVDIILVVNLILQD